MTLTGENTYAGDTNVTGGVLRMAGKSMVKATNGAIVLGAGGATRAQVNVENTSLWEVVVQCLADA